MQRGHARIESDDCLGAIEDFTQVIKITPRHAIAFLCRGDAYIVIENYENAVSDYSQAIKIAPNCTDAYFSTG